jgi:hypothetical protein
MNFSTVLCPSHIFCQTPRELYITRFRKRQRQRKRKRKREVEIKREETHTGGSST